MTFALASQKPEADWRAIADALYIALGRAGGCQCEFERTKSGVPLWFPNDAGGIGRKLIKQCSKCAAIAWYDAAVAEEVAA